MAVSVSLSTRVGGRTSSNASALRSRASWQQGPGEGGAALALHREHRARDLHGPLVVEDAVAGAELPVRDALVLAVGRPGRSRRPGGRGCRPRRRRRARRGAGVLGMPQQEVAHLVADARWPRAASSCSCVAERPALGLDAARPRRPCPRVRSAPTCLDSALTWLRSSSRSVPSARWRASSSMARSISDVSIPRRASAALTASGSVRIRRMSSMSADGSRRTPRARGRFGCDRRDATCDHGRVTMPVRTGRRTSLEPSGRRRLPGRAGH